MTLLISDSYIASLFLLTFLLHTFVFFIFLSAPQLTYLFFSPHTVQRRSGVDPCCPFCALHFLTITAGPSPDKSNGPACLPDCVQCCRSMGITVNALSRFCRVVECLLLMDTPVACFLRCRTKALSPTPWGTACRSQAVQSDQSYCPHNQSPPVSTIW